MAMVWPLSVDLPQGALLRFVGGGEVALGDEPAFELAQLTEGHDGVRSESRDAIQQCGVDTLSVVRGLQQGPESIRRGDGTHQRTKMSGCSDGLVGRQEDALLCKVAH